MKKPTKKKPVKRKPRAPKKPAPQAVIIPVNPVVPNPQFEVVKVVEEPELGGQRHPFDMENEELPDEPFYPHWTDRFDVTVLDAALKILQAMGYRVSLDYDEPKTEASQPPVEPVVSSPEKWTNVHNTRYMGDTTLAGHTSFGVPAAFRFDPVEETGFVKHDAGKTRFSLVPAEARLEVAKVFTHGAKKYPPHNYRKGTEWSRYVDALHRHMNDFELGQNVDEESGLLTLAHVSACAMILLTLQKLNKGTDDRAA